MKTYQLDGLNIYITNVQSKDEACIVAHACRFGVMPENLIEVERLPQGVPTYGVLSRPAFDPAESYAIDPLFDY